MFSTTTLIGLVNKVLLSMNERPLSNLNGIQGAQIRSIVEQSLVRVSQLNDWDFLEETRLASVWQAGRAILDTDVQRIKSVMYTPSGAVDQRRYTVPFLCKEQFYRENNIGQTYSGTPASATPICYTMEGWNTPVLHPYPTDVVNQNLVFFSIIRILTIPQEENGFFQMPEFFIPLLTRRCSAEYALRHLEDAALAAQFNSEFEVEAQALRDRHHSGGNQQHFSMNKRSRY